MSHDHVFENWFIWVCRSNQFLHVLFRNFASVWYCSYNWIYILFKKAISVLKTIYIQHVSTHLAFIGNSLFSCVVVFKYFATLKRAILITVKYFLNVWDYKWRKFPLWKPNRTESPLETSLLFKSENRNILNETNSLHTGTSLDSI